MDIPRPEGSVPEEFKIDGVKPRTLEGVTQEDNAKKAEEERDWAEGMSLQQAGVDWNEEDMWPDDKRDFGIEEIAASKEYIRSMLLAREVGEAEGLVRELNWERLTGVKDEQRNMMSTVWRDAKRVDIKWVEGKNDLLLTFSTQEGAEVKKRDFVSLTVRQFEDLTATESEYMMLKASDRTLKLTPGYISNIRSRIMEMNIGGNRLGGKHYDEIQVNVLLPKAKMQEFRPELERLDRERAKYFSVGKGGSESGGPLWGPGATEPDPMESKESRARNRQKLRDEAKELKKALEKKDKKGKPDKEEVRDEVSRQRVAESGRYQEYYRKLSYEEKMAYEKNGRIDEAAIYKDWKPIDDREQAEERRTSELQGRFIREVMSGWTFEQEASYNADEEFNKWRARIEKEEEEKRNRV